MTTERVMLTGSSTHLQVANVDHAAAHNAATDLIGIIDTVDVPIVVVRRDSVIAFFNKAAADVLGFSPADIGRASRDTSVLAGFPRLEERCSQVEASGVDGRADFRQGDKWFVVRISPHTNGDRQVTGTVLTFTNVTAFRASLDQAIYERECTKAIINTFADPLVVLSADQRIQSGNRAFYTMFGVSRDKTQGAPLYDLGKGAFELALLRTQLKEMLAGSHAFQPVEVDHVFTTKGQRTLILDACPLSFPGHSERRVLVTFQDITARKQAEAAKDLRSEEELRRSEAFLAEGQRLSLTGSFSWKVVTDEITWSEQLYRIFEFEPGTPVTIERINSRVHPEDVPMMNERIERARAGGTDFEYTHRLLISDGSVKYVNAIAHGSRDAEGRLEYIGAVQDVTQRRLSEQTLGKLRTELAHASRITTLGELMASIAHEVNQPLTAVVNNANACLGLLPDSAPQLQEVRTALAEIVDDADRASAVIARVRQLVRKVPFASILLNLRDVITDVLALARYESAAHHVTIRTDLTEDMPPVMGDRVQLQQVLLNLVVNGIDAMKTTEEAKRILTICGRREMRNGKAEALLSVKDTGIGLKLDEMDRLFEAFFTTKSQGMGMGLAISRSIIEAHGGLLWAGSNQGAGATFLFSLPAAGNATS